VVIERIVTGGHLLRLTPRLVRPPAQRSIQRPRDGPAVHVEPMVGPAGGPSLDARGWSRADRAQTTLPIDACSGWRTSGPSAGGRGGAPGRGTERLTLRGAP